MSVIVEGAGDSPKLEPRRLRTEGGEAGVHGDVRRQARWYGRRRVVRLSSWRSPLIRILRVVVPGSAVLLLAGVLLWPLMSGGDRFLNRYDAGEAAMVNARFAGFDDTGRPVSITADKVVRSARADNLIDLAQPLADLAFQDGSKVAIRATGGRFDEDSEQLILIEDVNLFQPGGFEFTTHRLNVDAKTRLAWSDQPVVGTGASGTIYGSAMRMIDEGRILVFPGRSRLRLTELAGKGTTTAEAQ